MAIHKPGREFSPKPDHAGLRSQTSCLQDCKKTIVYGLNYLAYGILLQQSDQTETDIQCSGEIYE